VAPPDMAESAVSCRTASSLDIKISTGEDFVASETLSSTDTSTYWTSTNMGVHRARRRYTWEHGSYRTRRRQLRIPSTRRAAPETDPPRPCDRQELPLGRRLVKQKPNQRIQPGRWMGLRRRNLERVTRLELATSTLGTKTSGVVFKPRSRQAWFAYFQLFRVRLHPA
jgi:hypothetical protein